MSPLLQYQPEKLSDGKLLRRRICFWRKPPSLQIVKWIEKQHWHQQRLRRIMRSCPWKNLAPQHSILIRIFGLQQHFESHCFGTPCILLRHLGRLGQGAWTDCLMPDAKIRREGAGMRHRTATGIRALWGSTMMRHWRPGAPFTGSPSHLGWGPLTMSAWGETLEAGRGTRTSLRRSPDMAVTRRLAAKNTF